MATKRKASDEEEEAEGEQVEEGQKCANCDEPAMFSQGGRESVVRYFCSLHCPPEGADILPQFANQPTEATGGE